MSMGGGLTDSSMEAVAIMNYLRVQHGAWAWLAAFLTTTAAAIISICRLSNRLSPIINIISISHSRSSLSQLPQPAEVISPHKDEKDEKETPCSSSTTCNTSTSSSIFTTTLSCTLEKTASGKFTLYYAHDDTINSNNISTSSSSSHDFMDLDDDDSHIKLTAAAAGKRRSIMGGGSSSFSSKQAANEWELDTLKIKTMDMGWYRHQDLSLLDGNVVRLWNQIQ